MGSACPRRRTQETQTRLLSIVNACHPMSRLRPAHPSGSPTSEFVAVQVKGEQTTSSEKRCRLAGTVRTDQKRQVFKADLRGLGDQTNGNSKSVLFEVSLPGFLTMARTDQRRLYVCENYIVV
jgi:hypothetical protein